MGRVVDVTIRVMGGRAHLVVVDPPAGAVAAAAGRLHDLDARWSRFREDSEIGRLNAAAGAAAPVSGTTALLLGLARLAWRRTGGRFDPTLTDALEASGYDAPLDEVRRRGAGARTPDTSSDPPAGTGPSVAARHDDWLSLDPARGVARLRHGARFDPGGIGKGLAADLVTAQLLGAGAAGACVGVGGDVRVAGRAPDADGWRVGLPASLGGAVALRDGAVAVSATAGRTWRQAGTLRRHLLDPCTGAPAAAPARTVATVAASAWWAEALATAAAVSSRDLAARLLGDAVGAAVADGGEPPRRYGALAAPPAPLAAAGGRR